MKRPSFSEANDDEVVDIRTRRLIATLFRLELISRKAYRSVFDVNIATLRYTLWKYKG